MSTLKQKNDYFNFLSLFSDSEKVDKSLLIKAICADFLKSDFILAWFLVVFSFGFYWMAVFGSLSRESEMYWLNASKELHVVDTGPSCWYIAVAEHSTERKVVLISNLNDPYSLEQAPAFMEVADPKAQDLVPTTYFRHFCSSRIKSLGISWWQLFHATFASVTSQGLCSIVAFSGKKTNSGGRRSFRNLHSKGIYLSSESILVLFHE